ncbi:hypothetical protein LBMAG54_14500 [Nitrosopumilaceae archaeon]|nr:hypothetical protein LBMAG54_14500 [Nitrosopumilaceae archaeon]
MIAGLFVIGSSSSVWAAQIDARINPNSNTSPFSYNFQKTIFIEYPNGGKIFDELHEKEWSVTGSADATNPGVQELIAKLNQKIRSDGSHAQISDLNVSYDFHLKGRDLTTSVDYRVILKGTISDYVITKDQIRTLVDMGWRGMSTNDSVIIDGVEINLPISLLKDKEPAVYDILAGTDADTILSKGLINADYILEQPMTNWHFLFDPTGVTADAATFGLDESISGFVVSKWTMGESSLREGRQVERVFEAPVSADQDYVVRSVQSSDQGNIAAIGFGAIDVLDGLEIVGLTPTPPAGYQTTSSGGFPVTIVYGMAGMAAIGGIAFFIFSNRALKNQTTGQQGIDPSRLVSYQTSASSGGYQTNRGEAQLADTSDYAQTRSVYEDQKQSQPPSLPSSEEAACGCAASAEIGSECDCEMHGSCLCDATCRCNASLCKEQVSSMS